MRNHRFVELLLRRLRETSHPGVASVDTEEIDERTRPVVRCTDGLEYHLTVVGTSPPGGNPAEEVIVEREPNSKITVRRR